MLQYTLNTSTGSTSSNTLPKDSPTPTSAAPTTTVSAAKSTGSLSRLPGVSGLMATGNEPTRSLQPATSTPEVSELIAKLPPAPTKLGVTTECVKKTTFTETVVKRVTNNQAKPKIEVIKLIKNSTKKKIR